MSTWQKVGSLLGIDDPGGEVKVSAGVELMSKESKVHYQPYLGELTREKGRRFSCGTSHSAGPSTTPQLPLDFHTTRQNAELRMQTELCCFFPVLPSGDKNNLMTQQGANSCGEKIELA